MSDISSKLCPFRTERFTVGVEKKKYLQDFIGQKWFLVKIEQSTVDEDNPR